MEWLGNNFLTLRENFPIIVNAQWEINLPGEEGCLPSMHRTCANLLRKVFDCEDVTDVDQITKLAEIELILGKPCRSTAEGIARFPRVRYEEVTGVDMREFWKENDDLGDVCLDWLRLKGSKIGWVLTRPDIFPKFYSEVSEIRANSVGNPGDVHDTLNLLPKDILFKFIPYLDIPSYLSFTSACRNLRKLALLEFQPHARKLVLSLPWATPLLKSYDKPEYDPAMPMVHPETSQATGDWLLYLSHIHRTKSMQERRRIWQICEEIKFQYDKQKPSCSYTMDVEKQRKVKKNCRSFASFALSIKSNQMSPGNFAKVWKDVMGGETEGTFPL